MSGINFDLGKIKGIVMDVDGVLSPSTIPMGIDGMPMRMVNIKDGYALQLAVKCGYKTAIITGGRDEAVRHRYEALGIKDIFLGAGVKIKVFREWLQSKGLMAEETVYIGDDIPDLECMELAGLAVAPADACFEARETAGYISRYAGGHGCVRDVVEQIMRAQGNWMRDEHAFGW